MVDSPVTCRIPSHRLVAYGRLEAPVFERSNSNGRWTPRTAGPAHYRSHGPKTRGWTKTKNKKQQLWLKRRWMGDSEWFFFPNIQPEYLIFLKQIEWFPFKLSPSSPPLAPKNWTVTASMAICATPSANLEKGGSEAACQMVKMMLAAYRFLAKACRLSTWKIVAAQVLWSNWRNCRSTKLLNWNLDPQKCGSKRTNVSTLTSRPVRPVPSCRKSHTRDTAGSRRKNKETEALLGLFICKRPEASRGMLAIPGFAQLANLILTNSHYKCPSATQSETPQTVENSVSFLVAIRWQPHQCLTLEPHRSARPLAVSARSHPEFSAGKLRFCRWISNSLQK